MWICYFPPELTHLTTIPLLLGRTVPVLTQWKHLTTASSALVKFPSVSYCGMGKDSLIDDVELKRKFGIVRPLCSVCKGQGRTHKVSHPNNITNKRSRII